MFALGVWFYCPSVGSQSIIRSKEFYFAIVAECHLKVVPGIGIGTAMAIKVSYDETESKI